MEDVRIDKLNKILFNIGYSFLFNLILWLNFYFNIIFDVFIYFFWRRSIVYCELFNRKYCLKVFVFLREIDIDKSIVFLDKFI